MGTNEAFEELMALGVQRHAEGDYIGALDARRKAWHLTPGDDLNAGRAARDQAASLDRLEWPEEAEYWARQAFIIHNALPMRGDKAELLRHRAASAMYVGHVLLRRAVTYDLNGSTEGYDYGVEAVGYFRTALSDIDWSEKIAQIPIDQYRINITGRASMAESLYGQRSRGLKLGIAAVGSAFKSESPKNPTSEPTLSRRGRLHAKTNALARGVAALGINIFASPKENWRSRTAMRLTNRFL